MAVAERTVQHLRKVVTESIILVVGGSSSVMQTQASFPQIKRALFVVVCSSIGPILLFTIAVACTYEYNPSTGLKHPSFPFETHPFQFLSRLDSGNFSTLHHIHDLTIVKDGQGDDDDED